MNPFLHSRTLNYRLNTLPKVTSLSNIIFLLVGYTGTQTLCLLYSQTYSFDQSVRLLYLFLEKTILENTIF